VVFQNKNDYLRFYLSLAYFNNQERTETFNSAKLKFTNRKEPLVYIHSYALLPNHFHLLVEPLIDTGLSEFMKRVSNGYTAYFNEHNNRSGALFQGKYKRVHVDTDEYKNYLLAYINENHLVHGLPEPGEVYQTSKMHLTNQMKSIVINTSMYDIYNQNENAALAKDIYKRRLELKTLLFETE
jgi:putative transposase